MKALLKVLIFGAITGLIVYLVAIGISIVKDPIPSEDQATKMRLQPFFENVPNVAKVSYPIRNEDRLFGGVEVTSAKGHKYEFEVPEISSFETASSLSLLEFDDYFFKCRNSIDEKLTKGMDFIELKEKIELPRDITGLNSLFEHEEKFVRWLSEIPINSDLDKVENEFCIKFPKL